MPSRSRALMGAVGAAALAAALHSCASISGLSGYSAGDCAEDCGKSGEGGTGPADSTLPSEVSTTGGPDGEDDAEAGPTGDGGSEAGCPEGFLVCEQGCVDPSSPSTCGSCVNSCSGEVPVCSSQDGGFACASECPSTTTNCSGRCVDTSTDPDNCTTCGTQCTPKVAHAHGTCSDAGCGLACDTAYSYCGGSCFDLMADNGNCGSCTHACGPGTSCVAGTCVAQAQGDAGSDAGAGPCPGDGGCPCPDGGCPSSTATGFSCPSLGHCNGSTSECSTGGGCFCSNDNQCLSGKCVKVTGENDLSCGGSGCSGSGSRDGYDCELVSPGIPVPSGSTYSCPAASGYKSSTLACDPTHTNCYCTADSECPSGKCVKVTGQNDVSCGSGCTGTGTADYRDCQAIAAIPDCPIYIGCPQNSECQYPVCYCTSDAACASGQCIPHGGSCSAPGCTGTGPDDGHGCMPAPSSVPCMTTGGGSSCTTTLTPTPVANAAHTACLCVADADCSSRKCVNANSQCAPGMCTGSAPNDAEDCETATSVANAWSCSIGNCSNVSSQSGMCTSAGVPCWCTSDAQCPGGAKCSSWAACSGGVCTGTGSGNAFNCVP